MSTATSVAAMSALRFHAYGEPADVLRATLLHLGDFEDWTRWLALAKVENPGAFAFRWQTPWGWVEINGSANDTYPAEFIY